MHIFFLHHKQNIVSTHGHYFLQPCVIILSWGSDKLVTSCKRVGGHPWLQYQPHSMRSKYGPAVRRTKQPQPTQLIWTGKQTHGREPWPPWKFHLSYCRDNSNRASVN